MSENVPWVLKAFTEAAKIFEASNDLLPCPFCGGKARMKLEPRPEIGFSHAVLLVQCQSCGTKTKDFPFGFDESEGFTTKQVTEMWNRRQADEHP